MVKIGTDILQRIADLGNWLTYDETLSSDRVQRAYNKTVSVFMVLERVLFRTFGSDEVVTHGSSAPDKKTVNDYIGWRDRGYKLADDLDDFIKTADLKYADKDEKYVLDGNTINNLVYEVMGEMAVVPVKK